MAPPAPISGVSQCRWGDPVTVPPRMAPVALREGTKVYKLALKDCDDHTLAYRSPDGEVKYTKRDESSGVWVPVKKEGESWVPDGLQTVQLLYSSVLDESALSTSKGKTSEAAQKDKELLANLKSGDKDKIKSVFKELGWGEPSSELPDRLEFTKRDIGAQVTYYLSDDKKRWSTVRPQWLFDQADQKTPGVHHDESLVNFKVDPRTGRVAKEVKKRAGVDIYTTKLETQGWRDKKTKAFDYIGNYANQSGAKVTHIGVTYGLPSIVNSAIFTTQPFKLPDEVPYTLQRNVLLETNIDVTASGANFRIVPFRYSDLNVPPSDPTGLNKNQYTSGNIISAGAGVVNHNKSFQQEGVLRIMEDSAVTAQMGALQMIDGKGESHWIPIFLISNDRTVVRLQPNPNGGPAFKLGFRTEALFPMADGGSRAPANPPMMMNNPMTEPEQIPTWADLLAIKNALYLTVGVEWSLLPRTNQAYLAHLDPSKRKVTGGEVAQSVIGDLLNAGVQLGTYASNVDIYRQRRKSGEENFDFFGWGNYLTSTIPAFLVYGPQDVANGEMAARMSNKGAALYFAGKTLGVLAATIPAAMVSRDKDPTLYPEKIHFATVPLAIREGAGVGTQLAIFLKERIADKLNLSNGQKLAVDEVVAAAFLVLGAALAFAPKAWIPGKATDTKLGNVQFGEHYNARQDPEAIWTWTNMDGAAAAGASFIGAGLNVGVSGVTSYKNRSERKRMQEAMNEAQAVSRNEKGEAAIPPPVPLVEKINLNLDANGSGAVARVGIQGSGEFALVPDGLRPRGRLDTAENRNATRLEELRAELGKVEIRLSTLEGVLKEEPDAAESLLRSRQERADQWRGEIERLRGEIATLEGETKRAVASR